MSECKDEVRRYLVDAGVVVHDIQERSFPGEHWIVVYVSSASLVAAQSMAGSLELHLNANFKEDAAFAVTFRPQVEIPESAVGQHDGGRLSGQDVTQLIQLLEARSRTSDALPSLKYVEDPRGSLAAIGASRHQLVYGRRGMGKTSLLLEAKRIAERQGHAAVWLNTHVFRELDPASAFLVVVDAIFSSLVKYFGSSHSPSVLKLEEQQKWLISLRSEKSASPREITTKIPDINSALRGVLRQGVARAFVFLDDYYLYPTENQPQLLDYIAGALRDCDSWLKIASIEQLTRPFKPSSKKGLEIPHDASKIDLDVTLEDPKVAQDFLESVLSNYTTAVGVRQPSAIANREALGRLTLASGGVPRDYLNLFASSIVVARQSRPQARGVGREDVAKAAGDSARSKKRDLELDVSSAMSGALSVALETISAAVKGAGYMYFRINMAQKLHSNYEILGRLVDLRFIHLISASLSDQHKAGTKYEAYILDLSEYTDVRLKRQLDVLDLDNGQWLRRLTGRAGTVERLTGTQLRDRLRQSPLFDLDVLTDLTLDFA
ncbi:P-loop NTPase family protein [Parafrankia elaeagni]|uniref:ATP-binding protein n=1 Tax=Parafrankia elaeagni TaxID=222534 RepID=UPI0012B5842C|nr:ATP-binding protein [Parafrankia elaeagni]